MRDVHVGTSGFIYKSWDASFYPPHTKDRLAYYASQFDTLEANVSFYRLPSESLVQKWQKILPANFHLVFKGSRLITHYHRLRDCEVFLKNFFDRVGKIKHTKVILWQLPPWLKRDMHLLKNFLRLLPKYPRHVVEFRHTSWWDDDVMQLLQAQQIGFVALSSNTMPDDIIVTTDIIYLRFHGFDLFPSMYTYEIRELRRWRKKLEPFVDSHTIYALFNNDGGDAVGNARQFRDMLYG
jgi:uncharacterized protein YecE (DUF72 family)